MTLVEAAATFRKKRRKYTKRYGKRLIFRIDEYLARQSLVGDRPVFDAELFPWARALEQGWKEVRAELETVLAYRERLPAFQDISPDQKHISTDQGWKTFVFYGFGHRSEQNCGLCPRTAALLEHVPGLQTAFFSILAPGKHVPPHRGVTKGLLRCHLGLRVPAQRERCTIDVGGVTCTWEEGRTLFFDDTYTHSVRNDTESERVVLFIDFKRPLTPWGNAVRETVLWLVRRSAYFRDARRNEAEWERRFHEEYA